MRLALAAALASVAIARQDHLCADRNSTKRDPYAGFKTWIRHFANNGDGDFGCYDPRDMQARYVTCTCERGCAHHLTQ